MKLSEKFEPKSNAEMSGDVVVQLLQLFNQYGIEVVVDGGWGVDYLDVSALCERFGIALPPEYKRFTQESAE